MEKRADDKIIVIPGEPVGKGRPRYVLKGDKVMLFTPKKTVEYEKKVEKAWRASYSEEISEKKDKKAYKIYIEVFFRMPRRASSEERKKMLSHSILPTKKPDLDNIFKIILDGLNGVAYTDDAQVVLVTGYKAYAKNPCVRVTIREV